MTFRQFILDQPPEQFLLRDDFDDIVSLGVVSGTLATPALGDLGSHLEHTRQTVDTEDLLWVNAGQLECLGGRAAPQVDDPLLSYPLPITRVAGQVVIFRGTITSLTNGLHMGLFVAAPPQVNGSDDTEEVFQFLGANVYASDKSATVQQLYAPTLGVEYTFALVLRAAGAFYFIRAGGVWLLLAGSYGNTNTPLYAAVDNIDAVFTISSIRVPKRLWSWIPLACDSFNRVAASLGVTDGIGSPEGGGANRAWTAQVGTWETNGTRAVCTTLTGGVGIATLFLTTPDVIMRVAPTWVAGLAGIVVRYTNSNNYAYIYMDGTNVSARQVVAGVDSEVVAPVAITYNPITPVVARLQGTAIQIGYGNSILGAGTLDGSLISPQCGMYSTDITNELELFIAGARGTGGEYVGLDEFIR